MEAQVSATPFVNAESDSKQAFTSPILETSAAFHKTTALIESLWYETVHHISSLMPEI